MTKYFESSERFETKFSPNTVSIGGMRECVQKFPDWVDNEIYA